MEVFGLQSEVIIDGIKYNVMIDDELDTNSVFSEEEGISAYDSYIGEFDGNLYSMTEEEVVNEIRTLLINKNKPQVMETKETTLYRLDITSACKDAQCLMGIDTRNNTMQGKEIYFKSLDKAVTYVKELLECGKRLSIIQGTDLDSGKEITFNTILNDLTKKENDYTTNNGRLFMSLRSIEEFIGLQVSISKKTIYIVD